MLTAAGHDVSPIAAAALGGLGGFLGAVLGGVVQLYRDHVERQAVERRRGEDAREAEAAHRRTMRVDEYRQTLRLLYDADEAFADLRRASDLAEPWSTEATPPVTSMVQTWRHVEEAHVAQWSTVQELAAGPLRERAAALDVVASARIREMFERYRLTAVQVADMWWLATRTDADEAGPPGWPHVEGWPPKIRGLHDEVRTVVPLLQERSDAVRAAIRAELGLED